MTQKRYTEIPKRQKCINKEEPYIGGSEDIDAGGGKTQEQVNTETNQRVSTLEESVGTGGSVDERIAVETRRAQQAEGVLDGKIANEKTRAEGVEGGLNTRLQTVEQLAEISIGGGDAQIATGSDFTNPDATKRAKVTTVGAVLDGINDGVYDVSKRNPAAGPNSDGKFTLEYILTNADTLIPTSWRHGGMTISFVDSSDNKYVQARCMAQNFTTDVTQWQGVDNEPTAGSENLVKSSGVKKTYVKSEKIVGKNLFNKNSSTRKNGVGQTYNGDVVYLNILAELFVEILPNTTYYLKGLSEESDAHLCFYNGDTYVTGVYLATNGQFVTPNNVDRVLVTSVIQNFNTISIYTDEQSVYEPYGIQGEDIDFDSIHKDSVSGDIIKEKTLDLNTLKGSLCNHFDKNNQNIETGYFLNANSGIKESNPDYNIVPVDLIPGTTYYISGVIHDIHVTYFVGGYEAGHFVGGNIITENAILNIPDGCDHIYFSVTTADLSGIMCSLKNEIPEKYVPFGSYLDGKVLLTQSVTKDKLSLGNTVLYHKRFDATADAEFIGDTYFDANGLFVGRSTNFITFNRSYFVKPRTIRLLVTFTSACSLTVKDSSGDSVANFNLANNTISCNTYSKSTTIFSNASDFYLIEIECDYNVGKIRVTNINTSETDELSATFSGKGGYGEGAVAEEIPGFGWWHDKYMFGVADAGYPCYIKEMSIVVPYQNCDMIVYGDSITEPEAYYPANDFSKSWTQLLKNEASYNILFSGRSGYVLDDVISTIKNELPYILPKYVMITIGTNGGVSEQGLRTLLDYILHFGSIPILNNIPSNEHGTQVSVNSIIERIRQEYGISGCRFDNATSLAMDGIAVDTTKMWWEDYGGTLGSYYHHPNPKGAKAMITQLKIDIPHIF